MLRKRKHRGASQGAKVDSEQLQSLVVLVSTELSGRGGACVLGSVLRDDWGRTKSSAGSGVSAGDILGILVSWVGWVSSVGVGGLSIGVGVLSSACDSVSYGTISML